MVREETARGEKTRKLQRRSNDGEKKRKTSFLVPFLTFNGISLLVAKANPSTRRKHHFRDGVSDEDLKGGGSWREGWSSLEGSLRGGRVGREARVPPPGALSGRKEWWGWGEREGVRKRTRPFFFPLFLFFPLLCTCFWPPWRGLRFPLPFLSLDLVRGLARFTSLPPSIGAPGADAAAHKLEKDFEKPFAHFFSSTTR